MTITNAGPGALAGLHATDERVATTIPVDLATDTSRWLYRVIVDPCQAGDLLDIIGQGGVTNDVGYNVGVGWHLWAYDLDNGGSAGQWWKLGKSRGQNVTPNMHHMELCIHYLHEVPATWPLGHRMVVVMRADAHSTAWQSGDVLTVDDYGGLTVRRWTPEGV